MKKIICILLAMLMLISFSIAEDVNPFAPYTLTIPKGAQLEESEGTYTVVSGLTRAVVTVIDRVPDENPAEAVIRMMAQFEPEAIIGVDVPMAEGFTGLSALHEGKFGEGVDQRIVMVLSHEGDLLILSAYDLNGDGEKAQALLDAILLGLTVNDVAIILTKE